MSIQFGAVEIPVGVPAADRTLNILAQIDARSQALGKTVVSSFEQQSVAARSTAQAFLTVEQALEAETAAARNAGATVAPVLEAIGENADGLMRRFEHLSVMSAFAFTAMADGSERGLTRLAHGVAFLGFAFGPVAGAITTFVAVAGEQLLDFWHKGELAATKAAEANQKFLDSIGEAKNLKASAERQQQLYSGAEYTTESDPVLRAAIKSGGIQGLTGQIDGLRAQYDKLQATVKGKALELVPKETSQAMDALMAKINPLQAQLDVVNAAYEKFARLTGQLLPGVVAEEGQKDRRDAEKNALHDEEVAYTEREKLAKARGKALEDVIVGVRKVGADAKKRIDDRALKDEDHFYKDTELQAKLDAAALAKIREADLQHQRAVNDQARELSRATAQIIGDTMTGLYTDGIKGGLRGLGDGILKALGELLVRIGERMLAAAPIFQAISTALLALDGTGLALGGAALIALGAAMGAVGSGSHSSGGAGQASPGRNYGQNITATVRPNYQPNTAGVSAKAPLVVNVAAFGKHDPTFQRELLEAIAVAQRRGRTNG